MRMKWLKPNEGRLHKGNPFKSVTKAVKGAVKTVGRVGEAAYKGDSDELKKIATSQLTGLTDPSAWLNFTGPSLGHAASAEEAYQKLSQSEKAEDRAKAAKIKAMAQEKEAQAKQEKMAKDKAAGEAAKAKERAQRMGQGRRGLLYQGKEAGVTGKSKVLGG